MNHRHGCNCNECKPRHKKHYRSFDEGVLRKLLSDQSMTDLISQPGTYHIGISKELVGVVKPCKRRNWFKCGAVRGFVIDKHSKPKILRLVIREAGQWYYMEIQQIVESNERHIAAGRWDEQANAFMGHFSFFPFNEHSIVFHSYPCVKIPVTKQQARKMLEPAMKGQKDA